MRFSVIRIFACLVLSLVVAHPAYSQMNNVITPGFSEGAPDKSLDNITIGSIDVTQKAVLGIWNDAGNGPGQLPKQGFGTIVPFLLEIIPLGL